MTEATKSPTFVNVYRAVPAAYEAMLALETASVGQLDRPLRELVKMRASQINGCAYCLDMHYKDARAMGETEERLYMLPAWREATVYSDAERAALALAEAMTLISDRHVPGDVEAEARRHFDEASYAALVFTIVAINAWNRLSIVSHAVPGRYRPKAADARA